MMPLLFSDIKYKDNNKENIDCVWIYIFIIYNFLNLIQQILY